MRYEVRQGSQSAHCCFAFTVIDTTRPENYGDHYHTMCECFAREEADQICAALNEQAEAAQRDNDILTGA